MICVVISVKIGPRLADTTGVNPQQQSVIPLLHALSTSGGSDLHVKVGSAPRVRVDGRLRRLQVPDMTPDDTLAMLGEVLPGNLLAEFEETHEADFAYNLPGVGRFRVNAYQARGTVGMVFRRVSEGAQSLDELGLPVHVRTPTGQPSTNEEALEAIADAHRLPAVIGELALEPRGLVLVTGPTGSGKTTTLASMVDLVNTLREVNIVTIEDPIEILHSDKKAIISQREVRHDTADFNTALRAAMRQDPDVILVGEMRDAETVRAALQAGETGHLVFSTLHTIDAEETINRIVDFFPANEQQQIRMALAQSLRGIVSQRLVRKSDGVGRAAVAEVMVNTGRTADAIVNPAENPPITDLIAEGEYYKMQTFDQHLFDLVSSGQVTYDDACTVASNPQDLTIELRGAGLLT